MTGVRAGNEPPVFITNPTTTAMVGQQYRYQAIGFDSDGDQLSYVLDVAPAGMTVDPASGLVTWTPTSTSPTQAQVVLQVYDSAGTPATQAFTIKVQGVDTAPVFIGLPGQVQGLAGQALSVPVQATDPQNVPLVFWADNLPPGATFDAGTHEMEWTPAFSAAGTYPNVVFTVSDGLYQVSQDVTIVIAPNPQPPTLARPADVTSPEGEFFDSIYSLKASGGILLLSRTP